MEERYTCTQQGRRREGTRNTEDEHACSYGNRCIITESDLRDKKTTQQQCPGYNSTDTDTIKRYEEIRNAIKDHRQQLQGQGELEERTQTL